LRTSSHELQLVSHQNYTFVLQRTLDCPLKNFVCYFRVYRTQRIVQQIDVRILIDSLSKTYSSFLTPGNVNTSFPYDSFLSICKLVHVRSEAARIDSHVKSLFIIHESKSDVFLNRSRKYKGLLFYISDFSLYSLFSLDLASFIHNRVQQSGFSRTNFAYNHH